VNTLPNTIAPPRNGDLSRFDGDLRRALANELEGCDISSGDSVSHLVVDVGFLALPTLVAGPDMPQAGSAIIVPVRISATDALIGPVFAVTDHAFTRPCIHCLEERWLALRSPELQLALSRDPVEMAASDCRLWTPFTADAVTNLALALLRGSNRESGRGCRTVYRLELETLSVSAFTLLAVPTCESCGHMTEDSADEARLRFASRLKHESDNYRLIPTSSYTIPVEELVNPVCGVLGAEFARDYANSVTSPVTGRFFIRSRHAIHPAWWSGHTLSYRSSLTVGLLEGLERYSGLIPRGKGTAVLGSYEELAPDALDPRTCGLYRPEFYAVHRNYRPFEPDQALHWVWGYSFQRKAPILVPEQLAYYLDHRTGRANFVQENSNGCASGSCMEEAVLFGLLELLERDAFLISWFARLPVKRIDPQSCGDAETLSLVDRICRVGYEVLLFDMRLDFPMPAVLCVARRHGPGLGRLVFAAGSSLDPGIAVRAALDEVASYVPGFADRVERNHQVLQPMVHDFSKVTNQDHHTLLYGLPEMEHHAAFLLESENASDFAAVYGEYRLEQPISLDLLEDLEYCIGQFLSRDMDVIVIDQTSPEQARYGIHTACVVVPGLMPIDFGWDRCRLWNLPRLRTVPQEAGYLDAPYDPYFPEIPPHPFP
jgi:ribosomal protein S12 methylthiotransferase accessory factor